MYLDINKYYYNKTYTKDGVTQIVDTSVNYIGYMVQICQNYRDCTEEEMLNQLILDLEKLHSDLIDKKYSKKLELKK